MNRFVFLALATLFGFAMAACSSPDIVVKCEPTSQRVCTCDNGWKGLQACDPASNSFGPCACEPPEMPVAGTAAAGTGVAGTVAAGTGGGDEDSGMPEAGSGAAGTAAGSSAGTGGAGGESGTGAVVEPWGACADVSECGGTDTCEGDAIASICSHPCTAPTDCPAVPSTGTATAVCNASKCALNCFLLTCPTGMTCSLAGVCSWPK